MLDVRPLVEVDICHLPFSLSILFSDAGTESASLHDLNCPFTIVLLMLMPDIPLSSLEERKTEHIRLLKERISQVKQQMSGDCEPPGNAKKRHVGRVHVV